MQDPDFCDPLSFTPDETVKQKDNDVDQESGFTLIQDPDEDPEEAKAIEQMLNNNLPPMPERPFFGPLAPGDGKKLTLVLDLDETLIHFNEEEDYFSIRPGCTEFLQELKEEFELCIFTASIQDYADWVIDSIDPEGWVKHRLYRHHCLIQETEDEGRMYIKDLGYLGRELSKTIIIDNLLESFLNNQENGILVKSWYDEQDDTELPVLVDFLKSIAAIPDVDV